MANYIQTIYHITPNDGDIPEEFKQLKEGMSGKEVNEVFGLETDADRWSISEIKFEDEWIISVYSANGPAYETWKEVAEKYDLYVWCNLYCDLDDLEWWFRSSYW